MRNPSRHGRVLAAPRNQSANRPGVLARLRGSACAPSLGGGQESTSGAPIVPPRLRPTSPPVTEPAIPPPPPKSEPHQKQVCLRAPGFLGDEVVFTGVVRELALETGWDLWVQSGRPELWRGHPGVAGIAASDGSFPEGSQVWDLALENHLCPPFRGMGQVPLHFQEAYLRGVREALGLSGWWQSRKFGGEVPLTKEELSAGTPFDLPKPYWVIAAGCKSGVPTKGWGSSQYQEVVEGLRGRVLFVQAGHNRVWHPPLKGVVDLVDRTPDLRDLIRLIYHAEGVLGPITSLTHLAAAVPVEPGSPFPIRPCVVIAGGREAPHFIQYPMHRVLHTIGQLDCCATGGCGKSTFGKGQCPYPDRLRDGAVVPRCMKVIRPVDVVAAIEGCYRGDPALPRGFGRVQAVFERLRRLRPGSGTITGAEIGILRGEMSQLLLRGHLGIHLTMVDRWLRDPDDRADPGFYSRPQRFFDDAKRIATEVTEFASDRRRILAMRSVEAAMEVPDGSLDFIFIDGDHTYEGCRDDIEAWFPKLKADGLFGGHDYYRPHWPMEGVQRAVDEFAAAKGFTVETDRDNCWFIHPGESGRSRSGGAGRHFNPL